MKVGPDLGGSLGADSRRQKDARDRSWDVCWSILGNMEKLAVEVPGESCPAASMALWSSSMDMQVVIASSLEVQGRAIDSAKCVDASRRV